MGAASSGRPSAVVTATASAAAAVSDAAIRTSSSAGRRSLSSDMRRPGQPGAEQRGGRQPAGRRQVEADDQRRLAPGDARPCPAAERNRSRASWATANDGDGDAEAGRTAERVVRRAAAAGRVRPTTAAASAVSVTAAVSTSSRVGVPRSPEPIGRFAGPAGGHRTYPVRRPTDGATGDRCCRRSSAPPSAHGSGTFGPPAEG